MMLIVIDWPGSFIDEEVFGNDSFHTQSLFRLCEKSLFEMALIFRKYIQAGILADEFFSEENYREFWSQSQETQIIPIQYLEERTVAFEHANPAQNYAKLLNIANEMIFQLRSHQGTDGRWRFQSESIIYAKAFCLTAAVFDSAIRSVITDSKLEGLSLNGDYLQITAMLRRVRDSLAHIDERHRFKARGSKIDLKPFNDAGVEAPSGAMILETIHGNKFFITGADGALCSFEISEKTIAIFATQIQDIINKFPWSGFCSKTSNYE